jgi:enoyl-CoA hydratase/carnithine racemase
VSKYICTSTSEDGQVATLRFADADSKNRLSWAAIDELGDALQNSRKSGARVIVLTSGLPGHWFQHASLEDLCAGLEGRPQTGTGNGWFTALNELSHETIVSIAAISGDSSGGGAELGWACDLRIAERQVHIAQMEVDAGLTTGIGGCSRLMRLAGVTTTTEMVLTGKAISSQRLFDLGAITEVVDQGASDSRALKIANELILKSTAALAGLKRILRRAEELPLSEALAFEQQTFQEVVSIDSTLSAMKHYLATTD